MLKGLLPELKRSMICLALAGLILMVPAAGHCYSAYAESQADQTAEMPAESVEISPGLAAADSDLLLEQFIENEVKLEAEEGAVPESSGRGSRGSRLTGNNRIVYDYLAAEIRTVASGGSEQAEIRVPIGAYIAEEDRVVTAEELGISTTLQNGKISPAATLYMKRLFPVDGNRILEALLYDLPYDFYWFDKTSDGGAKMAYNITADGENAYFEDNDPAVTFRFMVSADYSKTGKTGTDDIDTGKTSAAADAAARAAGIISKYSSYRDYDKIDAYRKEICALTAYDTSVKETTPYGDPWQLIYVFDGDTSTRVVCEGYAKAFKFLCDISTFDSDKVACYIATGSMVTYAGATPHMWNIVRMDDGHGYLADITNCDSGMAGHPAGLFLKGCEEGSVGDGYIFKCGSYYALYVYDVTSKRNFTSDELTLSDTGYTVTKIGGLGNRVYTGKAIKPALTVTRLGVRLRAGTDYTVSYSNNKNVGTASVKIKGKGPYADISQTVTFRITPKGRSISSLKKGKKSFTVRWSRQSARMSRSRITGYQIQYSTDKTFKTGVKTVTVKKYTSKSRTIKKLKSRKTYYVRLRTYMKTGGANYYSEWSKVRSVRTK